MSDSGEAGREAALAATFVTIADTLVREFDVNDVFDRVTTACVDLLHVEAAGIMIADHHGTLQLVASSNTAMRDLELLELSTGEGPCVDSYAHGAQISTDLQDAAAQAQWPRFAVAALAAGVTSVQSVPMRLRDVTIGALNIFHLANNRLGEHDTALAQALADVATIAILQRRAAADSELLAVQLQAALNDRIVIEQAKGALAERGSLEMDAAFAVLRDYCRARRLPLTATARELLTGERDLDDVLAHRWPDSP